jgi:hypothetical protein
LVPAEDVPDVADHGLPPSWVGEVPEPASLRVPRSAVSQGPLLLRPAK